jgi:hypothetical protein
VAAISGRCSCSALARTCASDGDQGIVEGEVGSAAQEEAVDAAGVGVLPDDLAHVV